MGNRGTNRTRRVRWDGIGSTWDEEGEGSSLHLHFTISLSRSSARSFLSIAGIPGPASVNDEVLSLNAMRDGLS